MSQLSGWLSRRYKVNRNLSQHEIDADLRRIDLPAFTPVDQGIIALNDTYIEYVDRHFRYRGWGLMWGVPIIALAIFFALAMVSTPTAAVDADGGMTSAAVYTLGFILSLVAGLVGFTYWMLVSRDIYRYRYYPVRFNRVSRMVHIFRDGKFPIISVPWDSVHFVIGFDKPIGPDEGRTYDLRGLVMREGKVIHVFGVGSDSGSSPATSYAHWEMIKKFMNSGASSLPFPPLQLYTSVEPSFRNAFIMHVSSAGKGMMLFALPLTLPWAVARYVAMKLCKKPIWSAEVERDCRIEPNSTDLRAPLVYGRVKHSGRPSNEMLQFWDSAIKAAKARDEEVRDEILLS